MRAFPDGNLGCFRMAGDTSRMRLEEDLLYFLHISAAEVPAMVDWPIAT